MYSWYKYIAFHLFISPNYTILLCIYICITLDNHHDDNDTVCVWLVCAVIMTILWHTRAYIYHIRHICIYIWSYYHIRVYIYIYCLIRVYLCKFDHIRWLAAVSIPWYPASAKVNAWFEAIRTKWYVVIES